MSASPQRQPIVVTHVKDVQFVAQVRSHRILVDQTARGGGSDAGPAPLELLGASLGTCVALYVQQFCHTRKLPHDGMRVEVQTTGAANPNRLGQFDVVVVLPAELPPQYAAMLQRVARSCPAHNTLVHGARVDVRIEAGVPSAA